MDGALDEDFVNFEEVSQCCGSCPSSICAASDEELSLLDDEASRRERIAGGDRRKKENVREVSGKPKLAIPETKSAGDAAEGNPTRLAPEDLFAAFAYDSTSKRLTMIPVKYKIKEERRKVLKISVNKLKKIDDPESWLCRSVLINNTMKKLQKEARDEKMNKHFASSSGRLSKQIETYHFVPFHSNRSNNNNNISDNIDIGTVGCDNDNNDNGNNNINDGYDNEVTATANNNNNNNNNSNTNNNIKNEDKVKSFSREIYLATGEEKRSREKEPDEPDEPDAGFYQMITFGSDPDLSISSSPEGKISSVERVGASREKSPEEDGTPNSEIFDPGSRQTVETEGFVDECDVRDVLGQLYVPPTPRMLTSIDADDDADDFDVVDDVARLSPPKSSDPEKLPEEEESADRSGELRLSTKRAPERDREENEESSGTKRRKLEDPSSRESSRRDLLGIERDERTGRGETWKDASEEEEDVDRRLSGSLSGRYRRDSDLTETCENFFEDNCDSQYSCGHAVTMFNEMQSVAFRNLIASLET